MSTLITRRSTASHGSVLLEIILSLTLLGMIVSATSFTVSRARTAQSDLSRQRLAVRAADQVVWDLQSGASQAEALTRAKHTSPEVSVRIDSLDFSSPVANQRWVRVVADFERQSTSMVGLVPMSTAELGGEND